MQRQLMKSTFDGVLGRITWQPTDFLFVYYTPAHNQSTRSSRVRIQLGRHTAAVTVANTASLAASQSLRSVLTRNKLISVLQTRSDNFLHASRQGVYIFGVAENVTDDLPLSVHRKLPWDGRTS